MLSVELDAPGSESDDLVGIKWQLRSTSQRISQYWEFGYVRLPNHYFRIKFEATSMKFGTEVQLAIDDITVSTNCSSMSFVFT